MKPIAEAIGRFMATLCCKRGDPFLISSMGGIR